MAYFRNTILSLAVAVAAWGAHAQTDAEHAQHHPSEPAQKATTPPLAKADPMVKESMAAMDSKMKIMREMHEKMMAAKTPGERRALMGEHMKAMREGMTMDMMGHHELMEKRMDMMTSMMQMMMDRLPDEAAK